MAFLDQYPYTNFHNVNLDWVLERVKEWGAMVEDNNTRFENLNDAFEDFKTYVTDYLDNLDVQSAIDDKLDRMFESGELTDYLQPYISSTVTTWLEENITEPTGVVIDSSLTVAGACADAKSTGDAISNLIPNTLDIETRNLILNMFRRAGYIDSDDLTVFNELQEKILKDDIFNIWHWDSRESGKNKLYRIPASVMPYSINGFSVGVDFLDGQIPANNRRNFCINKGLQPMVNHNAGTLTTYYPIPIPKTAHKMTANVYPSTEQLCSWLYKYYGYLGYGSYEYRQVNVGNRVYVSGTDSFEFTPDSNLFVTFSIRRDATNTAFTNATEPELEVIFE